MNIFTLTNDGTDILGLERGGRMLDLTRSLSFYELTVNNTTIEPFRYIEELILDGRFTLGYLGEVVSCVDRYGLDQEFILSGGYTVNAPVYPGKIIALGNNYHEHIREMNQRVPEKPVLFGKWPSVVIGPDEPIIKPASVERLDYEAELAVVIGSKARKVTASDAMGHVAGYTCLNDVTARDVQKRDIAQSLPWMPSKNYDTFAPMGPCVLLKDAVPEPVEIDVQSRVNGELRQNGNTRDFIFDIPAIIEYISHIFTLEPCDIITTGTPVGVGSIEPGDVVEITCGGIGTLSNPVIGG